MKAHSEGVSMKQSYLPSGLATITEACEWLQAQTGEPWTLARLIEQGLKPYFWFDYTPDIPQASAIFGHHDEGILACIFRKGDRAGLGAGANEACITHIHAHDDKLVVLAPAHRFPIDKLRFSVTDIKRLSINTLKPAPHPAATFAAAQQDKTDLENHIRKKAKGEVGRPGGCAPKKPNERARALVCWENWANAENPKKMYRNKMAFVDYLAEQGLCDIKTGRLWVNKFREDHPAPALEKILPLKK